MHNKKTDFEIYDAKDKEIQTIIEKTYQSYECKSLWVCYKINVRYKEAKKRKQW